MTQYLNRVLIKRFLLLWGVFLISGCTEKDLFEVDKNGNIQITSKHTKIHNVEVISWKVGPRKKQEVSKGIRIGVKFPILDKDDMAELIENKGIDSWLIRLQKRSTTGSSVLGSMYVPLITPGQSGLRVRQLPSGFIDVYYAAAALSTRFENFMCPAFEHQKTIKGYELEGEEERASKLRVSTSDDTRVIGKISKFSYVPAVLNGGMELRGRYSLELALFNAETRTKKSNFITIPGTVDVESEVETPVKGCVGFEIPEKPRDEDKVNLFNFGGSKKKRRGY